MPGTIKDGLELSSRESQLIASSPTSAYRVRLAANLDDVRRAQRLRYQVFNVEMGEGLESSLECGRDEDKFDQVCDHLIVESTNTGEAIGTYRLQPGEKAERNFGFYSEQEFDLEPFHSLRSQIVELGRACIAKPHRTMVVLGLLWKGIARCADVWNARYLIGCSSIPSTNPVIGLSAYHQLLRYQADARFVTQPNPGFECSVGPKRFADLKCDQVEIPRLLRAYLSFGARICGEPALDREFKTIDFLTLMDLQSLDLRVKQRYFS